MLVDTQPATHQPVPASPEVREQWVESQLIGVLMDSAMRTLGVALIGLPVMVYLLWGEISDVGLLAWLAAAIGVLLYRYRIIGVYRLLFDSVEGPSRIVFINRYKWTWAAVGFFWGATIGLTFREASLPTQYFCLLLVLGHGLMSLSSFTAYLPILKIYVNSLVLSMVAGLIIALVENWGDLTYTRLIVSMGLLLGVYWYMLLSAGVRLYEVHRASYELQFSNQELIDSLTQQTRASLRAVATKNRFLSSAAHDLRQPVHALSLYADWLATEPEMARDISPRILQSTRAINELFDSLFDLTRIDAGNYKVRLQNVDVQQLFTDLVMQFEPVAAAKNLKLRFRTQDLTVWSDPIVLRRILGNLVSNALRHTQNGGVLISARRREDLLVFEVWDTGVGIARQHQQAIFQEFFRVSQHQGTEDSLGLGLTIVSKLATLMGYQLSLNSEEGRGSVFRVILPAFTQGPPREALPSIPGTLAMGGKKPT